MSQIMKIIDKWEKQKNKTESKKGDKIYSGRLKAKYFWCAFKLEFLELIWKVSLLLQPNLELAWIIILKDRIIQVNDCSGTVQMFKNMRLFFYFEMFLNPSLKITTSFANIARTTASTSQFIS